MKSLTRRHFLIFLTTAPILQMTVKEMREVIQSKTAIEYKKNEFIIVNGWVLHASDLYHSSGEA